MVLFFVDKLLGAVVALPIILIFLFCIDRDRLKKKWFWAVLFVMYMNAMLNVVGIPSAQYIRWDPEINWIPLQDASSANIVGMFLNVLMFVPFGAFLPIYFARFRKVSATVLAGVLMSFTIEGLLILEIHWQRFFAMPERNNLKTECSTENFTIKTTTEK